jgi:DNA-binding NarL/FixJ family response regulator
MQATQFADPKAQKNVKMLIVDDHAVVRHGLKQIINAEPDMSVCGEAEDASTAVSAIDKMAPDLAIVDISLKNSNGMELIKDLKVYHPDMPVLVFTMHDEALFAERVLRAGAKGYVMKQSGPEVLIQAIRKVMKGDIYVSDALSTRLLDQYVSGNTNRIVFPLERLTDRELEVFQLIGEGNRTREIADVLHLSVKTVETYCAHIKEKLELKNATELVQHAVLWVLNENKAVG